jgi:hypothetical protein
MLWEYRSNHSLSAKIEGIRLPVVGDADKAWLVSLFGVGKQSFFGVKAEFRRETAKIPK